MKLKLFIETYGCQMNSADSEVIAAVMEMAGYELSNSVDDADAVLLNTCSIRDNAEQKIISRLQYLQSVKRRPNVPRRSLQSVMAWIWWRALTHTCRFRNCLRRWSRAIRLSMWS